MQLDSFFLFWIVRPILSVFTGILILFVAFYFASRIMAEKMISRREAIIGALIGAATHSIVEISLFFILPVIATLVALLATVVVLFVLVIRFYKIGFFSAVALIMITMVTFLIIDAVLTALIYILFVPIPF